MRREYLPARRSQKSAEGLVVAVARDADLQVEIFRIRSGAILEVGMQGAKVLMDMHDDLVRDAGGSAAKLAIAGHSLELMSEFLDGLTYQTLTNR